MEKRYTALGEQLSGIPWNTYPRPSLRREAWLCLNGLWDCTIGEVSGTIRVPFCPESLLSGWTAPVKCGRTILYRRDVEVPEDWRGKRILLHFGAVNRTCSVTLNGKEVFAHEGGYFPFTVEVTKLLRPGNNQLEVRAVNDLSPRYPWGKQRKNRGGMWYTPVSGIWQTVWMEPVPERYIQSLHVETGRDWVEIQTVGISDGTVELEGTSYPLENGRVRIRLPSPKLWSPEEPNLYSFTVSGEGDCVSSYFALRTLSIREVDGIPRLCLNETPYFFHGLLDQGYWSDGIYTPPGPESYAQDINAMKALGFNTLRKHIKIEPEQFYYDCDRLGMIVFQDMVNCGKYRYIRDTVLPTVGFQTKSDLRLHRDPIMRESFLQAMEQTVALLRHHPSIVLWTIFNEGWGQFCADAAYRRLKTLDPTRFIDATSGWFRQKESDVDSLHIYFDKLHLGKEHRPQLLSEFGGYSYKIPSHSTNLRKNYGYRNFADRECFVAALRELYQTGVLPLIPLGLCGAIYTQVSDVEDETNGILTYDRRVQKLLPEEFADVSRRLCTVQAEGEPVGSA